MRMSESSSTVEVGSVIGRWIAPPLGWLKTNWDVALERTHGVMGGSGDS
jgi:hypothetical protein